MSTKIALVAAALFAVLSGPALAHGRPSPTHARILRTMPLNAYDSVRAEAPVAESYRYQDDFQLQGRF